MAEQKKPEGLFYGSRHARRLKGEFPIFVGGGHPEEHQSLGELLSPETFEEWYSWFHTMLGRKSDTAKPIPKTAKHPERYHCNPNPWVWAISYKDREVER